MIKTVRFWHKKIDQWNRIESPEIKPCTHDQLISVNEARTYHGAVSSVSGALGNYIKIRMLSRNIY